MEIEIWCGSDDLIEVRGDIEEEFYGSGVSYSEESVIVNGDFAVKMKYGDAGLKSPCWMIGVQPLEEEEGILEDYKISIDQKHEYSPRLVVEYDGEIELEFRDDSDE